MVGKDVTPKGAHWSLANGKLALELDDSKLPTPYLIDPAITFRAASVVAAATGGTTLAPAKPTGTTTGDVMVAAINSKDNFTVVGPAGWILIGRTPNTTGSQLTTFYKVATAVEGTTYTFTVNGSALDATAAIETFISATTTRRFKISRLQRARVRLPQRRTRCPCRRAPTPPSRSVGQRADARDSRRVHESCLGTVGVRDQRLGPHTRGRGQQHVDVGHIRQRRLGARMRLR